MAVSGEQLGGEKLAPNEVEKLKLVCTGDKATFRLLKAADQKGSFQVMDVKELKVLDLKDMKGQRLVALYELDGDTLRLCYGEYNTTPPLGFDSEGTTVLVLKRKSAKK